MNNNAYVGGTWQADHDLACGDAMSQRTLESAFEQDTTGANGWQPYVDFHLPELVYVCRDHVMDSMGDISAFTVLWFAPNMVFLDDLSSVSFDVNLTDLGGRKWWKVGVVSTALYNSSYTTSDGVSVPGHVVSDVGSSNLDGDLQGSDRLIATWGGAASAGYPGCLKVGNTQSGVCTGQSDDKMARLPVSLVDNHNGTVTFTVDGTAITRSGSFPACPCRVVFYDQNYNPLKDGPVQGLTWHWDSIVVN